MQLVRGIRMRGVSTPPSTAPSPKGKSQEGTAIGLEWFSTVRAMTFSSLPTPSALRSVGVLVETAPALDPEPILIDVLAYQLTGAFRDAIAHGGVVLLYGQHDVQADAVHEPKGGHAGAREDLPHGVDVFGRRDTFLDHHQALALDRGPDAVENEPVALAAHPEGHQPVVGELLHERFDDPLLGLAARHQFDSVELGRLLIVCVQHALGMLDLADHLAGGDGGGVAAQDRVGLGQPVQLAEDLGLDVDSLWHCLDHHPCAGDNLLQVVVELDTSAPVGVQSEHPLGLGDVLFYVLSGCLALLLREVEDVHFAAATHVHRGDPAPERPRPVDHDRALINISRRVVGHDIAPPRRVARFKILEYRLAYELPGALEVQPQRLLERDPKELKTLQLPSLLR